MDITKHFGKTKLPSLINDPFNKTSIENITVRYSKSIFSDTWSATGYVYFKNNDTKGEQKFEGETFDEVVIKIKQFIDKLNG